MSFSEKELFREINDKCTRFNNEAYLINAISIIDSTVEASEIDAVFVNEYYKVKRRNIAEDMYSSTVVVGLVVSIIGAFAFALTNVFGNAEISEIIKVHGKEIFAAVVILGLAVCRFVIYNGLHKRNTILYPYLEKKMEDRIVNSPIRYSNTQKKSVTQRFKCFFRDKKYMLFIVSIIAFITLLHLKGESDLQNGQIKPKEYLMTGCVILASVYFALQMASLLRLAKHRVLRCMKNWSVVFGVILITLAIPIGIHFKFYSDKPFTQEMFLSAYTEYLSFLGAFALGYYLYKREEVRSFEALKKKARMIYESMLYIQMNFENIDFYIERGETYSIPDNWKSDYLDIKHLVKYEESALSSELHYFFGRVVSINKAIEAGDKERAKRLYSNFIQKEQYSSTEYNYMNAAEVLLFISLDMPQNKTWKNEEKEQITKYANAFFDVVNSRLYNHLIKNHLTSCDLDDVEYELVDWLLQNPELKAWVKHPYDKRKVSAVLCEIALSINKRSPNLNYYWREFSFK